MTDVLIDSMKIRFEEFISLIGVVLAHEKEIGIIQNKLRRRFNTTSSNYICSSEFQTLLDRTHRLYETNEKSIKYYSLLATLSDELKKHSIISKKCHRSEHQSTTTTNERISHVDDPETPLSLTAQLETIVSSSADNDLPTISDPISISDDESKCQREIQKLEKRLSRLANTIAELEHKEMSLEEMEHCDLYVVESNLKKRAYEIHKRLVQLKNQSTSTGRILHQPLVLSDHQFTLPQIKKTLQNWINQTKFFPSFPDVLNCIEKANDEHQLQLSNEDMKKIAEDSFKIIGKLFKDRRMSDFHDIMTSRLPENFDIEQSDPASGNVEMQNTLVENKKQAVIKTEQIFEEYSQIDPELQEEVIIPSSDQSSNENEQDDENEVDNSSGSEQEEENETETIDQSHKSTSEIATTKEGLIILSTAKLPKRKSIDALSKSSSDNEQVEQISFINDHHNHSYQSDIRSSINISNEKSPTLLIPRHRQYTPSNETIYQLYQERLTNCVSSTNSTYQPKTKRTKEREPDLVVLD